MLLNELLNMFDTNNLEIQSSSLEDPLLDLSYRTMRFGKSALERNLSKFNELVASKQIVEKRNLRNDKSEDWCFQTCSPIPSDITRLWIHAKPSQ